MSDKKLKGKTYSFFRLSAEIYLIYKEIWYSYLIVIV